MATIVGCTRSDMEIGSIRTKTERSTGLRTRGESEWFARETPDVNAQRKGTGKVRRHGDDCTALALRHRGQESFERVERRCQILVQCVAPVLFSDILERCGSALTATGNVKLLH